MTCPLCRRLADEHDPERIADLAEGVVFLGENQGCPGWCVLVLRAHVEHMADLEIDRQSRIFADVARVASAIRAVVGPVRLNYECLGNVVAHVHWHVIPRHPDDPTPTAPVWNWPPDRLLGTLDAPGRSRLARRLREALPVGGPS